MNTCFSDRSKIGLNLFSSPSPPAPFGQPDVTKLCLGGREMGRMIMTTVIKVRKVEAYEEGKVACQSSV